MRQECGATGGGRLIGVSEAAKKVLDYIETRHGSAAMYGMDYVSALPADKQAAVLSANPQLVYGIVAEDYDTLAEDPNIRTIDTGEVPVYIYDRDRMEDMAMHLGDNVFAVSATPSICWMPRRSAHWSQRSGSGKQRLAISLPCRRRCFLHTGRIRHF